MRRGEVSTDEAGRGTGIDFFHDRCGFVSKHGDECGYWSLEGSPVNLCRDHLRGAYEWAAENLPALAPIERVVGAVCPKCDVQSVVSTHHLGRAECEWCGHAAEVDAFPEIERRDEVPQAPRKNVVYYVVHADRIKIGTSSNWRRRLAAIPHDRLLALEPGGAALEMKRHQEFRGCRVGATEWFTQTDDLWDRIVQINDEQPRLTSSIDQYNRERRDRLGVG